MQYFILGFHSFLFEKGLYVFHYEFYFLFLLKFIHEHIKDNAQDTDKDNHEKSSAKDATWHKFSKIISTDEDRSNR